MSEHGLNIAAIKDRVEKLSEAFVLADAGNLQDLGKIHTEFEAIAVWASGQSDENLTASIKQAADLVESVILRDVDDPAAVLETVGHYITTLQAVIVEGRALDSVTFPAVLQDSMAGRRSEEGAFSLPSHVDREILTDFLARQGSVLGDFERDLLSVESGENDDSADAVMRTLHTLKGECGLLGINDVERLCHIAEDACQADGVSKHADTLLAVKDWLEQAFAFIEGHSTAPAGVSTLIERFGANTDGEAVSGDDRVKKDVDLRAPQLDLASSGVQQAIDSDPELLAEFITEACEHLQNADVNLLSLETNPKDSEALNTVFRAFHTIKGVASFMGLDDVRSLSHEAEDLLDAARKGNLLMVGSAIDVTFEAVDSLKHMVDGLSEALDSGAAPEEMSSLPDLLNRISMVAAGNEIPQGKLNKVASESAGQPLGKILVDRGAVNADDIEAALEQQKQGTERQKLGEILVESGATSRRRVEAALKQQAEQGDLVSGPDRLGRILVESGDASTTDVFNALNRQRRSSSPKRMGEILVRESRASAKDVARALREQGSKPEAGDSGEDVVKPVVSMAPAVQVREALKVDADRLDLLVDTIGELVIAESMVSQSREVRASDSDQLLAHVRQLSKITRELQEMATALRMVPMRSTFQRMARVVRDVAKKAGKPIDFTMEGEDTELDKAVVDRIGDPLIHLVRNAVDHGIEISSKDRTQKGKPPAGRIALRAYHKGGNIYVEISDDGRGLDREAIIERARENGLLGAGDTLSDDDILNLIFSPGFSTAKEVTEVSGRGVGLDVVRKNIQLLRGEVDVQSQPGEGTTFVIRLPLTLAIIEGMVVHVGGERYILPALSMVTAMRPEKDEVASVMHRGEMLRFQGDLVPMFRLAVVLGTDKAKTDYTESIAVVVEYEGKRAALMVDELVGRQQIVIKSLGEALCDIPGIAGGAVMPDGRVGLILDVPGLIRLAGSKSSVRKVQSSDAESDVDENGEDAVQEDKDG